MTYLPPANGGRINATISGNTAGAGSLVSSGTLTLAGGNNITLSQNGNAITISGPTAGGAGSNTLGMSNLGNTAGTTGMISGSALQFAFAGGNNITLSQSINASSATITVSAANQSAQTQSNVQAFYDGVNSISTGTVRVSNANGISFGINGQTLTASHNALTSQSVQTQNLHNVTLSGNSTSAGAGFIQVSSGTLTLAGGNNVTLSQNGNAVTVSAANQTVQTQNLFNMSLSGNTAGVMAQVSSGTLTLAGGNNITLSQNGNAVTISAGAGGGGGGVALANSQATYSTGTVNILEGGGAVTIATSAGGQSFKVSVPQTSSLSATGIVSIATNGSTISIGAPGGTTLSRWEYPNNAFTSLGLNGQGSLSVEHMYVPFNITGTAMKVGGSVSGSTNTSATTASANISLWMGIYTLTGSTLSLASSGSATHGFQWSQSASSASNTSTVNGMRQLTVPMNVNMTPGEYWVGAVMSSQTTYTAVAFSVYGNNLINGAASGAVLTPIGSGIAAARDALLFQGIYTAATSAGPASMSGGHINNTAASNVMRANFYNAIFNATY